MEKHILKYELQVDLSAQKHFYLLINVFLSDKKYITIYFCHVLIIFTICYVYCLLCLYLILLLYSLMYVLYCSKLI